MHFFCKKMPVSIQYSFLENSQTISIQFKTSLSERKVHRFYSKCFVKVHDTQTGQLATIDLFAEIKCFPPFYPTEEWVPDGLKVTFSKCEPGFWNRIGPDPHRYCKEDIRKGRKISIQEAETQLKLLSENDSQLRLQLLQDNAHMELERHESIIKFKENLLITNKNEAIETINLELHDYSSIVSDSVSTITDFPIRRKCEKILLTMTPKIEGRPARVSSEIA